MNFYNDNDPATSRWLSQLIEDDLIPEGTVDDRSILDIKPEDLAGYDQCHFFAGIGGWAEALRLAGVPTDFRVWTGSPPCQPFSVSGLQLGPEDPRHLGPRFVDLVRSCRPPMLFGEQVASAAVIGRAAKAGKPKTHVEPEWSWWDDLSLRLEAAGYATWAGVIPAAGVGAPHIRQRTFFGAADLDWLVNGLGEGLERLGWNGDGQTGRQDPIGSAGASSVPSRVADSDSQGCGRDAQLHPGWIANPGERRADHDGCGPAERLADAGRQRRQQDARSSPSDEETHGRAGRDGGEPDGNHIIAGHGEIHRTSPTNGFWGDADWILCRDGKWRPTQSSVLSVVDGLPNNLVSGSHPLAENQERRVMRLRGYGNAIVPQAAAHFIQSSLEMLHDLQTNAGLPG